MTNTETPTDLHTDQTPPAPPDGGEVVAAAEVPTSEPVPPVAEEKARRGLQFWITVLYTSTGIIAVGAVIFSIFAFTSMVKAREELVEDLTPASIVVKNWQQSLIDQENGIRGFTLTGDEDFLEPFNAALVAEDKAVTNMRKQLKDHPELIEEVDALLVSSSAWEKNFATPAMRDIRAMGPSAVTAADQAGGKALFDQVRADAARLEARVTEERDRAQDRVNAPVVRMEIALMAVAASVLVAVFGSRLVLGRMALAPLAALRQDASVVAGGNLDHQISRPNTKEFRELADDVEAMRTRIIEELAVVEQARARLESQAADLERSNRELEQFAYVASHDLQEPLRKVTGFCQLLQRRYASELDERAEEYISYAVDGAKRMQRLINELLGFSRVGRTTTRFTPVDLNVTAANIQNSLSEKIEEADAAVTIGDLPTVQGDESLLEALLQNLVSNAIKFRGENAPVVDVSATRDGEGWAFECRDNGIGIEPDYADRVFVIFQRLHDRETYEGTGIGLAMCRKIVEFHGGKIWVDAEAAPEGGGTVIRWYLPDTLPDHHLIPTGDSNE